ncbi:ComF family protein [Tepidanaerobacter acetatoxydans]|uniref:ComF family protein n=1 Tax=Tepidanaerobacter acetatoxydans TaxID=499229 RepID=UPI001BD4DE04|nr:ComF family protein [Tepidanaerobacter acetatoxydans]
MSEKEIITNFFLDILFPPKPYCLLCGNKLANTESIICENCKSKIEPLTEPLCGKCGKPLKTGLLFCNDCQNEHHAFAQARSYGRYEGALKQLIYEFKYNGRQELAEILGQMMFSLLKELSWPDFDYLVPLPLHAARQRERGFNQAYLLTKVLARKSKIPVFNGLKRVKPTEHQTFLDKSFRRKNLEGAFKVVKNSKIHDKIVLLIDDVYTTGATTGECSKSLLEAGVKAVYVMTCARG